MAKTKRPPRRGEAVPPEATKRLMELVGVSNAAKLLGGIARETLHRSVRDGLVTKTIEELAVYKLAEVSRNKAPADHTLTLIETVGKHRAAALLGVSLHDIARVMKTRQTLPDMERAAQAALVGVQAEPQPAAAETPRPGGRVLMALDLPRDQVEKVERLAEMLGAKATRF